LWEDFDSSSAEVVYRECLSVIVGGEIREEEDDN
jgi:hypothetical protein